VAGAIESARSGFAKPDRAFFEEQLSESAARNSGNRTVVVEANVIAEGAGRLSVFGE
jgi:hypothetical protein